MCFQNDTTFCFKLQLRTLKYSETSFDMNFMKERPEV